LASRAGIGSSASVREAADLGVSAEFQTCLPAGQWTWRFLLEKRTDSAYSENHIILAVDEMIFSYLSKSIGAQSCDGMITQCWRMAASRTGTCAPKSLCLWMLFRFTGGTIGGQAHHRRSATGGFQGEEGQPRAFVRKQSVSFATDRSGGG